MKKLFIPLLFVIILLFAGCKDNGTQPLDTSVIWPLKVGNYWDYRMYDYDSNGSIINDTLIHLEVITDTTILGRSLYKINDEPIYFYNLSDGLYVLMLDYSGKDTNVLFLKYPANNNDYFNAEDDTTFVTNTSANIIVPAGSFNCYQYSGMKRYGNNSQIFFKMVMYFAPGIGWIKTENYDKDFYGNVKLYIITELISYKLY